MMGRLPGESLVRRHTDECAGTVAQVEEAEADVVKLEFQLKRLSSRERLHSHLHRIYSARLGYTAAAAAAAALPAGAMDPLGGDSAAGVPGFPPFPIAPGEAKAPEPSADPGVTAQAAALPMCVPPTPGAPCSV